MEENIQPLTPSVTQQQRDSRAKPGQKPEQKPEQTVLLGQMEQ
jgi:hypothetical protein